MEHEKKDVFARAVLDFAIKKHKVRCIIWCICIVLFIIAGALGDSIASGLIGGFAAIPFIMITWFTLIAYKEGRKEIENSTSLIYLLTRKEEKAMFLKVREFYHYREQAATPCKIGASRGDYGLIADKFDPKEPLSKDTCDCLKENGYFACRCISDLCHEPWLVHEDCPVAKKAVGSNIVGGPYAIENLVVRTGNKRDAILAILYYHCSKLPGELLLAVAGYFYDEERNAIKTNVLTALRYMARYSDSFNENLTAHIGFILEVAKGGVVVDYLLRLFPYLRAMYRSPDFYRWDTLEMAYTSTVLTGAASYMYDHYKEEPEIDFSDLFFDDGTLKSSGLDEGDDGDTIYSVTHAWDEKYHFLPKDEE